jgi:hypothetical protein
MSVQSRAAIRVTHPQDIIEGSFLGHFAVTGESSVVWCQEAKKSMIKTLFQGYARRV